MDVSHRSTKIYHLRRPSALRTYGSALVWAWICLAIVIGASSPVKFLFVYPLIGGLLSLLPTFRQGYAVIGRDRLRVKYLTLMPMKIPYSNISVVEPLPAQSIGARLGRLLVGGRVGDAQLRVTLERTAWVFVLFPFPIAFPTKKLWLQFENGDGFAGELAERLVAATADGRSR